VLSGCDEVPVVVQPDRDGVEDEELVPTSLLGPRNDAAG
jgi:hypothetical protein